MASIREKIFSLLKVARETWPLLICQIATLHLPAEVVCNPVGTRPLKAPLV